MAKSKNRNTRRRDHYSIPSFAADPVRVIRAPIDDRRTWHPEGGNRPPLSFSGVPADFDRAPPVVSVPRTSKRYRAYSPGSKSKSTPSRTAPGRYGSPKLLRAEFLTFSAPRSVIVCARRIVRKQVLHALKRLAPGGKRGRRSWLSKVRC